MKKAITLVALAGVAMTTEFEDNDLNVFKKIGTGLKKAGQFVVKHPKIITTAASLLLDDEELFSLKDLKNKDFQDKVIHTIQEDIHKVKEYAAAHPELVERVKAEIKKYKHDKEALKTDVKHAMEKIAEHPEILAHTVEALKKFHAVHKLSIEADDHELFNKDLFKKIAEKVKKGVKYAHEHPEVVQDGKNIVKDIKNKDKKALVHDTLKTLLDLGFEDEELFNKDKLKKIADKIKKGVEYVKEHPEVVQDGKNIVHDIKTKDKKALIHDSIKTLLDLGFEDEEFFNRDIFKKITEDVKKGIKYAHDHPEVVQDGKNIIHDIKTHDKKALVHDTLKTLLDLGFDDEELEVVSEEELFKIGKVLKGAVNGVKKGAKYVAGHPALIKDGVNIVKDVKTHNWKQLIKDGIKTYKDAKADEQEDEEFFKIGKFIKKAVDGIKKGTQYVAGHPALIKDGANIVKDIKTHNYKQLIKDGIKTYKDARADDDELFAVEDEEFFNKDIFKKVTEDIKKGIKYAHEHPEVVQDGKNIIHDIKTKDKKALIHDTLKTLLDLGFEDEEIEELSEEEFFKIGNVVKKITSGVKKGVQYVAGHPALIKDGANIVKDVKTHNWKQLIKDGFKTYKDARADEEEDEEFFKIGKFVKKAVDGAKKGAKFVAGHPALIKDGVNIVKDVKNKNVVGLIKDGIKTYKDIKADDEEFFAFEDEELFAFDDEELFAFDDEELFAFEDEELFAFEDEELFSLKNTIHKATDFVKKHPAVIKDGVNIVKDVKNKNVIGLVKDGIKTYKDLGFEDQEFFAFGDEELFQVKQVHAFKDLGFEDQTDNALFSLGDLIKDGKKIKEDIKTHNVKDLIKDGAKTIKDVKEVKKFLF